MNITFTNCRHTPKWETLQQAIREATDDEIGVITGIRRIDGNCDYRGPGEYDLTFRTANNDILPIKLDIQGTA